MASIYIKIPPSSGSSGAVDSVNGKTGVVIITKTDVGLSNVDNTSDANKPVSSAVQAELDLKQDEISSFNSAILYQVSGPGDIQGIPNWAVNSLQGLTQTPDITVTAGFGESINNCIAAIDHAVVSLDKNYQMHYNRINTDVTDTGNAVGTNGRYASFVSNDFFHDKESNIGEVAFTINSFELGLNGALSIDVNGWSYANGFGQVRNNVTIKSNMLGYGFQPSFDTGSLIDVNANLTAFYDNTNAPNTVFGLYTGLNFSPNIGGIQNNRNMNSILITPTVGEMFGNAGYQGIGIGGTFGDFGTGNYQGIQITPIIGTLTNTTMLAINPTIAGSDNATGLDVNMSNVTGTNVSAAQFTGNVQITGNLSFTGALSIGALNAFASSNMVNGAGVPTSIHSLVSGLLAPNGVTTANADMIGVNTASLMTFEEDSVTTSGPFGLGACSLALPSIVTMETTATAQHVRGAAFAINLDSGSTGGTIANAIGCWATIIPNGVTTVSKFIAYDAALPFGAPNADDSWGFHCSANIYNYMAGSLVIGSTQEKTTNTSIGLEIASTTKAFMNARMTTTERNALTAVNGMQIYNSTTDKLQVYAAGSWVDLH